MWSCLTSPAVSAESTPGVPVPVTPPAAPADSPAIPADGMFPDAKNAALSYGVNFGMQFRNLGVTADDIPMEALVRGIREGMAGKQTTVQDIDVVKHFGEEISQRIIERNHAAAQVFLDQNAKKPAVRRTAAGLQYEVLAAGDTKATSPHEKDLVTVNYTGRLLDGTEFDDSYKKGKPGKFLLSDTIQGWQEALPLMKPGAKWRLYVPPQLAYGDSWRPGIPAGSLLVFEIELVSATPTAPAQASKTGGDTAGG
jgi:FKBP-type peptidyl-prolyl cis-trans isomerase